MCIFRRIPRTDKEPRGYSEGHYTFLDRSARPQAENVRELINCWFSRYPIDGKKELRNRMNSGDERQFESAFFELFLHEMLSELHCGIDICPLPAVEKGKRPDFLVSHNVSNDFYLEAVNVTEKTDKSPAAEARMNLVYDIIERNLDSQDFWLSLRIEGAPRESPPARRLVEHLSRWLRSLEWESVTSDLKINGINRLPTYHFSHDIWRIEFTAHPKSESKRGEKGSRPIGMQTEAVWFEDSGEGLKQAIKRKASRYGKLVKPYIIAVNLISDYTEASEISDALYGSVEACDDCQEPRRLMDGAFTPKRNTRVSGVLVCSCVLPYNLAKSTACLYHNPWARLPCPNALGVLPCALCCNEKGVGKRAGKSPREILALPEDWPKSGR